MEKFEWSENYSTNILQIDLQHRGLFKKIDGFSLSIYKGESKKHLRELLLFLEQYIENHFTTEENLMALNNYPDISNHKTEHDKFRKLFSGFKDDFNSRGGDSYLSIRLEKEIRKWWESHILNTDMKYSPYIKILNQQHTP